MAHRDLVKWSIFLMAIAEGVCQAGSISQLKSSGGGAVRRPRTPDNHYHHRFPNGYFPTALPGIPWLPPQGRQHPGEEVVKEEEEEEDGGTTAPSGGLPRTVSLGLIPSDARTSRPHRTKRGSGVVIRGPFYPYPQPGHPLRFTSPASIATPTSPLLLALLIGLCCTGL